MKKAQWTLTECAKLLRQPQHRLIYLCEKRVVIPEFSDASGRGSSRRFSASNIFEFSIALTLSEFHFPAAVSARFLYAIRSFESNVRSTGLDDFSIPYSLMNSRSPDIIAIITDGTILYFSLGFPGSPKKVFGGVDINMAGKKSGPSHAELQSQVKIGQSSEQDTPLTASNVARFEISLTAIAQSLNLD